MYINLLLWTIWLLTVGHVLAASSSSPGITAHVHSRDDQTGFLLIDALRTTSVNRIVVVPDRLDVAQELEGLPSKFRLDRNVTITGAKGTHTVFDQQFQRARLQLCGRCTVTFSNITVANDSKGSGLANELFVAAELGARLILQNANVLRLACPSPADALGVLSITPRSSAFQGAQTQQQHSTRDITLQGATYADALFAQLFSTDVAPSQEGRNNIGGYALLWQNTGRPCKAYVPTSCLDSKSMDTCTQDLTDQLLADNPKPGEGSLQPGVLAVAVVVPIVAVALAAAGTGWWCYRRRQNTTKSPKTFSKRPRDVPPDISDDTDVESGCGGTGTNPAGGDSGGPVAHGGQPLRRPLGSQAGWSVAKACTTPYLGAVDDARIEFGELIGSGSFGRVYQAKWAGRDVAVKVIEHNTDTTVPVEREVTLMLSFNHPNIVRAFHFVTRVHTSEVMPLNGSKDSSDTAKADSSKNSGKDAATSNSQVAAVGSSAGSSAAASGGTSAAASAGSSGRKAPGADLRVVPPLPPSKAAAAVGSASRSNSTGSNNSRSSASGGSSSDKSGGGGTGSVNNHQLQLVQRLPSLTGAQPKLVHKVETWLVQEYCDCGTLAAVASEWKHEPESDQKMLERLQLLYDCAKGLRELHSRSVVHGDLNARNVLLSSSGMTSLGVVAKLADLGLSRIVRNHRSHHSTNTVGTMSHVAPELLRYGHMSTAGDIYSFGIMMWELYTGQAAFRKLHVGQFFEAIVVRNLRPMIPRGMAADYQLLMQSCWSANPVDRPSCDRLLNCIKLMIEVRQQRQQHSAGPSATMAAAAAAEAAASGSAAEAAVGPGTFGGGYSAPLPAVAAASDAGMLGRRTRQQHQQELRRLGASTMPIAGLPHSSLMPPPAAAAAAAAALAGSAHGVQLSAYSTTAGAGAAASAAVSALPGLLALLKERAPQFDQQQLMRDMAGGRLHSSCPEDARVTRSNPGGGMSFFGDILPRLTPINTGRRSSAESSSFSYQLPIGHSQSDPLPRQGGLPPNIQQQMLLQLQQQLLQQQQQQRQYADTSGASFHGFPEPGASSVGSSSMQTPWLGHQGVESGHLPAATPTLMTPLTGVKYHYPSSSRGTAAAAAAAAAGSSAVTSPLPGVTQPPTYSSSVTRRLSTGSTGPIAATTAPLPAFSSNGSSAGSRRLSTSSSGPLRLPGTSSLARSGSLGTSSRHWYWQRSPAFADDLDPDVTGCDNDTKSVTDQNSPGGTLGDELQPGCSDIMAQVQINNNWYV